MCAGGKQEKEPHNNNNLGCPHSSVGKASTCNAGDLGSIPGSGRSPGEGNGNPPQYSCLENPMEGGAWQDTVHGVPRVGHNLVTKPPPITNNKQVPPPYSHLVCSKCFIYPYNVVRWHHTDRFAQGRAGRGEVACPGSHQVGNGRAARLWSPFSSPRRLPLILRVTDIQGKHTLPWQPGSQSKAFQSGSI